MDGTAVFPILQDWVGRNQKERLGRTEEKQGSKMVGRLEKGG